MNMWNKSKGFWTHSIWRLRLLDRFWDQFYRNGSGFIKGAEKRNIIFQNNNILSVQSLYKWKTSNSTVLHIYDSISGPHLRRITSAALVYILSRPGTRNSCGSMFASALTSTERRRQTVSTARPGECLQSVGWRWPLPACRPSGCPTTSVPQSPPPVCTHLFLNAATHSELIVHSCKGLNAQLKNMACKGT